MQLNDRGNGKKGAKEKDVVNLQACEQEFGCYKFST